MFKILVRPQTDPMGMHIFGHLGRTGLKYDHSLTARSENNNAFVNQNLSFRWVFNMEHKTKSQLTQELKFKTQRLMMWLLRTRLHLNSILSNWKVHFFLLLPFCLQRCLSKSKQQFIQYQHTIYKLLKISFCFY